MEPIVTLTPIEARNLGHNIWQLSRAKGKAFPGPDPRAAMLVELRAQLEAISAELRGLVLGSPEHLEVLKHFEPIVAAVEALA